MITGHPHRIAAGAIVIKGDRVLLVRYPDSRSGSILVAPGGGLEQDENIAEAAKREVREETGMVVEPTAVVMIEDLVNSRYKMCKIWMICQALDGEVQRTPQAEVEGISEVGWYTKEELRDETVYPSLILEKDWAELKNWPATVTIPRSRSI